MTRFTLSSIFADADIAGMVEDLTEEDVRLDLDALLDPLAAPYATVDPIKTAIWQRFNAAVVAAFCAGLAAGLEPSRILFPRREVQP